MLSKLRSKCILEGCVLVSGEWHLPLSLPLTTDVRECTTCDPYLGGFWEDAIQS